ncbi:hypothetical protein R6Q59_031079 [Mikania micrantha]
MANRSSLTVVIALTVIAVSISTAQAQAQTCASKLVPCGPYLNSTATPPSSCCDPIKETVRTDLQCLCNLYANPSFLSSIGVNIEQALRLPRLCGVSSDTSVCKTAQAPNGSGPKPPPANTPGGNSAGRIASSGAIGLLLISVYMMLF